MTKKLAIITGTGRGIGKAIMERLLDAGFQLISINRNSIDQTHPGHLANIPFDLSDIPAIPDLMQRISRYLSTHPCKGIWLINNAARLGQVKRIGDEDTESLAETIETNLISPMNMSSLLVKSVEKMGVPVRIIHISSGAAFHPIHGLAGYCISKAGLEMLSKSMALEYGKGMDFKSVTIGPGVVDTDMQAQIRSSDPRDFTELERFVAFKEKGNLEDPVAVASKILRIIESDRFSNGDSIDLQSYEL